MRIGPKLTFAFLLSSSLLSLDLAISAEAPAGRERLLLDFGWKFHLGNDWGTGEDLAKADSSSGAAKGDFADAGWRTVRLPHDWAIELPFDEHSDSSHGFKPVGPGFPQNSVGWYRRTFTLPKEHSSKRLWLEFDGAYRDTRVFVNGYFIGHHESGYSNFRYDITDVANCGGKNVVSVRVDASQFEGWFYEGAGLYRHVWLVKTAPLAIAPNGIFVHAQFKDNVPQDSVTVVMRVEVANQQTNSADASVKCRIVSPDGNPVAEIQESSEIKPWSHEQVTLRIKFKSPVLWSPESPKLYKLVTTVESGGQLVDQTETEFGIRTVAFDANKGFLLNGKPYELYGTCNHQDHAGVGAALPDRLQYFRVARLKEMGGNAYRTSHNPPTPELLEACDRLGMLVMDESRLLGSDAANLDRLEGLVKRDRNHPSVVVWSIGNEEGVQTTPTGGRIAETMQNLIHGLDPTRSCTMAANVGNDFGGLNRIIDVRGWNYHIGREMDAYHAAHPSQPNVGTEQASTVSTRGIYANDTVRGYVSAYDDNAPPWAHTAETWWKFFAPRPWLSGGFAWTGFDYRGEPTPYGWPCINSHFGILDTCGFPKDNFYYYQAWWTDRTVLHLLPHWTWPSKEGQEIDVRCLSNCEEVELFLNDQSLGKQTMPKNSQLRWKVKYAPGTLSAKGFKGGSVVAEEKVETTGLPAAIKLTPERPALNADAEDVSIITVAVTDAQGRVVPVAGNLVNFELSGPGKILGVGNGDPSCHEPDVYIETPAVRSIALNDWRMQVVPGTRERPETAENFWDESWRKVDVRAEFGPLNPGESAVFRTRFIVKPEDLAATNIQVNFGMIDDEGWVYVNGQFAGEAHDWSTSQTFDIRKFLHPGENTLAVAVKNHEAQGGLNKGITLDVPEKPTSVQWKRSVFNGLAQIVVQSSKEPGELKLTARADGLQPATLSVQSQPCTPRPTVQ
ncbi:MAG TPA: beta-galactosidase GalA [Candidatus Acidoferrum sp.]|jgi:beta-galactosidase|nr:beta-galactosidase GalA [Candidatus Acidoferrum sp.]